MSRGGSFHEVVISQCPDCRTIKYRDKVIVLAWIFTSSQGTQTPGRRQAPRIYQQATVNSVPNPSGTAESYILDTLRIAQGESTYFDSAACFI